MLFAFDELSLIQGGLEIPIRVTITDQRLTTAL